MVRKINNFPQRFMSLANPSIVSLINSYKSTECLMKKARILKEVKDKTDITYIHMTRIFFESERTLKRLYQLNKLIPQLQEYLSIYVPDNTLPKMIFYEISRFNEEEQEAHFINITYMLELKKNKSKISQESESFMFKDYKKLLENDYLRKSTLQIELDI